MPLPGRSEDTRRLQREYLENGEYSVVVLDRLTPESDNHIGDHEYSFPSSSNDFDDGHTDRDSDANSSHNLDSEDLAAPAGVPSTSGYNSEGGVSDCSSDRSHPTAGRPQFIGEAEPSADGVFWEERRLPGGNVQWLRLKRCTHCQEVVNLGDGSSLHAYETHFESIRCKTTAKAKKKDAGQQRLDNMFRKSGSTSSAKEAFAATPRLRRSALTSLRSPSPTISISSESESVEQAPDLQVRCELRQLFLDSGLCPGVVLDFPGPLLTSYPLHLHHFNNLGFSPEYWVGDCNYLTVRSRNCHRVPRSKGAPCAECASINSSPLLARMRQRAVDSLPASLNFRYYNINQFQEALQHKNEEKNVMKLKILNLTRKYNHATAQLSDHERFMNAIAFDDFESIGRLVQVALRNHKSVREIIRRLELAIEGKYHVKSYEEKHYEVQRLVLTLGGPRLAYTIVKALNLPSISTTREHLVTPTVLPSIGFPSYTEISANLDALHHSGALRGGTILRRRGYSLQIDEIALGEHPRYDSTRDAILGMSRENAEMCDLSTVTLETLEMAADALDDGSLSLAKEATIVALAAYDRDYYVAFPLLISGTNKTEDDVTQARWIELTISVLEQSPHGEEMYGELWSIGSDGDATRRRALHPVLMQYTLGTSSKLYALLSPLRGLNLQCGSKERTLTIDYKHKFKNFASLLRLPAGLLVLDQHIHRVQLRNLLFTELNLDNTLLTRLFDNKDHQNVPNVVALLSAVKKLALVPALQEQLEHRPLVVLGHFIGFLVEPFTVPTMSLSDQLISLSAANHLLFLLYRRNRTSFCPGQWYYDVSSLVKNIFFTVVRQKLLDSTQDFYISQDGTDRLEGNFGIYRDMDSSHNLDILQLSQRSGLAAEVAQIYAKHPEWDRGHKRLRLEGVDGVDHTNPRSWKGNVCVQGVSLLTCWKSGLHTVQMLLKSLGVAIEDASGLGHGDQKIDLLRPFGEFVGLIDDFDYTAGAASEQSGPLATQTQTAASKPGKGPEDVADVELEDILPEAGDPDLDSVRKSDQFWLKIRGKDVHKASAIRCLLGLKWDSRKSTDRLSRVQGLLKVRTYSREPSAPQLNDDSIIGEKLLLGEFVATFMHIGNTAALAILRVSEIFDSSHVSVHAIPVKDLTSTEVVLRGQVLTLKLTDLGTTNSEATIDHEQTTLRSGSWAWTGGYESFHSGTEDTEQTRAASKKSTLIEILARLAKPITIDEERRNRFLWGELPANLCDANPCSWEKYFQTQLTKH